MKSNVEMKAGRHFWIAVARLGLFGVTSLFAQSPSNTIATAVNLDKTDSPPALADNLKVSHE